MDTFTREQRSENMRRIKGANTAPEIVVRRIVRSLGAKFRCHPKNVPGKPDFAMRDLRLVVFVHGCFWHGHRCQGGRRPKSNVEYWTRKLEGNLRRDRRITRELRRAGWRRLVIWECELGDSERVQHRLQ